MESMGEIFIKYFSIEVIGTELIIVLYIPVSQLFPS